MEVTAWKSKMARRLVRIFVLLVAIPLIVTVLTLGYLFYAQSTSMAWTINRLNRTAIQDAGRSFQQQGGEAVRQSATHTQQISIQAIRSMSQEMTKEQEQSLHATARDFSALTRENVQTAMQQSLVTNRATLNRIRDHMTNLFEKSAQATQQRASGNIEKAMLALNDTLMRERAARLALAVSEHISDANNFLTLTAQMPGMSDGEVDGQKATLDSLVRRFPQFLVLTVLNKSGRETAMSASDRATTPSDLGNHSDADYYQAAIHGQVYVSLEKKLASGSVPTLRLAVPIEAYRGKTVGVLAARLSLEDLWDSIQTARIGRHGFAYIIDQNGRTVTPQRKAPGKMLTSSASIEALHNTVETLPWRVVIAIPREEAMQPVQALNGDISDNTRKAIGEMHSQIQSESQQASSHLQQEAREIQNATGQRIQSHAERVFQRLSDTTTRQTQTELAQMQEAIQSRSIQTQIENDQQMGRMTEATSARLTERVQTLSNQATQSAQRYLSLMALVIMVVSCSIGSLIALFTAGRIVRPVVRLAQAADALAAGDLKRRVDENAPDEIGDLASAFNTMAKSLQQSRTDLNEAESQLVQSAKLASLGTLSAGVAHELNQPVAIIRGLAQQLKSEPELSPDIQADLEIIEGQTGRMTKIIKHLRTFSRTGGAEFLNVEVHSTLQDCLLLVGEQLRTHNVEIEYELCDGSPVVCGDANELEQVFLNLITNARDALEGRANPKITIRSQVEDGRIILEFRDNGTGIPAAVEQHIFDPFFTTKEPGKGTGLGLSISHTIIAKHHGEIRVHNDNGAVFTIHLPLAETSEEKALRAA